MWEFSAERLAALQSTRVAPDLPDSARLPDTVVLTDRLPDALAAAGAVVLALPTQTLRANLDCLADVLTGNPIIVSVMKGIEIGTRLRVSEIILRALPKARIAVLTGPGIPYDVAAGDPTSLVVAAPSESDAQLIRDNFSGDNLRLYSTTDLVGAELGGALKNVMAIAAGIVDGIGLGINAKAAMLTRGLYEITRLGIAQGANPMTFAGLSGIGDLIVTGFSPRSRNYRFGVAIAEGKSVAEAIAALSGVAEGYYTCQAAYELAAHARVELPITTELHRILYESAQPKDSIKRLLSRSLKSETWS
jgi:glycerol-3-phosphate dehydrogenase (NAD(P)+)